MSRSLQDQFIDDDEEETCPLCVEEFDLTDKGFRPCPCGYQICQFCYHNVKTNMNGLCPACRRTYRDEDIEYKVITPEETAAHKARQAQKQKKTQAALQKEKQKAEADNLSRKHLAGMRVVQKNLVYVTGLSPTSQEDQLLQTLRGDQYFGQYGEIIKIVVSKAKDLSHPHSVGVYVTYKRKEDAASCIAAVDGSKNGDRTLRAQFGTTKYCSAYLRGETCTNRNCMFLHEPGEANESYSRADLSALNAGSSQHGQGRPPPPQSQQPVSAAPMVRQNSDQPSSPSTDRPALPSTASWASKAPQPSRAESRSTSTTLESPAPVNSTPAPIHIEPTQEPEPPEPSQFEEHAVAPVQHSSKVSRRSQILPLIALLKYIRPEDFKLVWSSAGIPQTDLDVINNYPPLFDQNGGARRRIRKQREDEARRRDQEAQTFQQPPSVEQDDNPEMSGSLQLGGEPEERQSVSQIQSAIQPPGHDGGLDQRFQFGGSISSPGISERGLTPQQHQQIMLQTLKPNSPSSYVNGNQGGNFPSTFQQQSSAPPGHQRNVSRFSFANESSASAAVKPVANPKLMNQQSSMMPPSSGNHFGAQHQQPHGQFYTSNVQGPPPGLKTTGTPPVSGNLTFGQGHGFATGGLQYGAGTSRNQQDNYYRELLRGRDAAGGSVDAKRELHSFPNYNTNHQNAAYPAGQSNAFPNQPYVSLGAFGDGEKQRKKKGKKHRHANTSSSSGGGVVDDPSTNHLLQARIHQSAGIGGSAFAGQTGAAGGLYSIMHGGGYGGRCDQLQLVFLQGVKELGRHLDQRQVLDAGPAEFIDYRASSYERSHHHEYGRYGVCWTVLLDPRLAISLFTSHQATSYHTDFPPLAPSRHQSITSRISLDESRRLTPPVPPGLESQHRNESRRSTPTIPPGLTKPIALPDLDASFSRPSSRPSSRSSLRRTASQITPALPLRPGTPAQATPSRKITKEEDDVASPVADETPVKPARSTTASDLKKVTPAGDVAAKSSSPGKTDPHDASSAAKHSDDIQENANEPLKLSKTSLHDLSVPVLSGLYTSEAKNHTADHMSATETQADVMKLDVQKRKHPGKLDITAAVSKQEQEQPGASTVTPIETSTSGNVARASSQTSSSRLPESPSVASPGVKAAPRTLRVVPTPKTETPPAVAALPPNFPIVAHRLPSRQPSVASINPPGTPSSEHVSISDNISLTSASQSRASSPPPSSSKVGSAPVRSRTKNQLKKERQERAKAMEEEKAKATEDLEKPSAEEPAQEAIISRKKKTKKEKESKPPKPKAPVTNNTTPTASRPASPGKTPELASKTDASASIPRETQPTTPTKSMALPRQPASPHTEPSPPATPTLTAAQLVAELRASAPEIQKCIDSLFRVSNSNHFKASQSVSHKDLLNGWRPDFNVKLSKDEIDALLAGKVPAVYRGGEDGQTLDRHMITPSGAHLRALTKELEARFLELEKALREMPEEFRFRPSKPQNELKLPSINLEELKRKMENSGGRGISVMEQMVQDGSTMKKGAFLVDEASKYINEFVMPPVTPPPSAGGQARSQSAAQGTQASQSEPSVPSVETLERQMNEARRIADEKENALKKIAKKNKKMLGLG